jgi:hypothetical protein
MTMKYLVLCVTVLASSAIATTASAGKRFDCARFQSAQQIRMTKRRPEGLPSERYVQLRIGLEERNQSAEGRTPEGRTGPEGGADGRLNGRCTPCRARTRSLN